MAQFFSYLNHFVVVFCLSFVLLPLITNYMVSESMFLSFQFITHFNKMPKLGFLDHLGII